MQTISLDGYTVNLSHINVMWVSAFPDYDALRKLNIHEREYWDDPIYSTILNDRKNTIYKIYINGPKSTASPDIHKYFHAEAVVGKWYRKQTYKNFYWVPNSELNAQEVWNVRVEMTNGAKLTLNPRTLLKARKTISLIETAIKDIPPICNYKS